MPQGVAFYMYSRQALEQIMTMAYDPHADWRREDREARKRGCSYATGYGLPWVETCGAPVVGKWHAQDDEWFCATHIRPSR